MYNSGGYAKIEALEKIAPYVDIWLPDLKFYSPELAKRYTGRPDYFEYASKAIAFMAEKPVQFDGDGKMLSGLLVRHLVMPGCSSDSLSVLSFLKQTLPDNIPISVMRQYTPMGNIAGYPELNRKITVREYGRVVDYALSLGFETVYTQEKDSAQKAFIPDWDF